jgi:predicted DCC family thiol-disulfide oxidoreductase YuxK
MDRPSATTVYYDGDCPVCRREIGLYQRAAGAEAVRFVNVAAEAPPDDLSREAALARLHVRRPDGQLVSGAAGFAALWQSLPRWRWIGRIASTPPVTGMLEGTYRGFLRARRLWRRA